MDRKKSIGFVSLGCPKALVDSEKILTRLSSEGYVTAPTYADAGLVIVNTCGFITPAQEESLDAISEALEENGQVIVTGCLGAKKDSCGDLVVPKAYPNVLAVSGPDSVEKVIEAVHRFLPLPEQVQPNELPPQGIKLTPSHYAYLKISEGCAHHCSFCIIPDLRGKLVSYPIDEVLNQAEMLFATGTKELMVVSQDTGAYGLDVKFRTGFWNGRPVKTHMTALCEQLGKLANRYGAWVRLHYIYPYAYVDEVVALMNGGGIVPYVDVPLQHAHPDVLRRMKRPGDAERNLEQIQRWRQICPDITIRSTFITGFPGETDAEFECLLDFIKQARLDRVGCFTYSPVEGAQANALPNPVDEALKEERRAALMEMQQQISYEKLHEKVGKTLSVIVDERVRGGAICRSYGDAPEIDGLVYVKKEKGERQQLMPGTFINVRIDDNDEHDMWGTYIASKKVK